MIFLVTSDLNFLIRILEKIGFGDNFKKMGVFLTEGLLCSTLN